VRRDAVAAPGGQRPAGRGHRHECDDDHEDREDQPAGLAEVDADVGDDRWRTDREDAEPEAGEALVLPCRSCGGSMTKKWREKSPVMTVMTT